VDAIKIRRLGWAGHFVRLEDKRPPPKKKRFLTGNFKIKDHGKTKNKMEGRRPEGHITVAKNTSMEETSRRQKRMEAPGEGGQGPEGAVAS
jgi:hypothetical protein